MARYLVEAFTPDRQAAEITDPAGTVLLAEYRGASGDAELAGYAHLVSGSAPAAVQGPAALELNRLYVARAWHGQGVASSGVEAGLPGHAHEGGRLSAGRRGPLTQRADEDVGRLAASRASNRGSPRSGAQVGSTRR